MLSSTLLVLLGQAIFQHWSMQMVFVDLLQPLVVLVEAPSHKAASSSEANPPSYLEAWAIPSLNRQIASATCSLHTHQVGVLGFWNLAPDYSMETFTCILSHPANAPLQESFVTLPGKDWPYGFVIETCGVVVLCPLRVLGWRSTRSFLFQGTSCTQGRT